MNKSIIFRIVLALVLIGAVAGLGAFAFNAGLARGLAMSAPPAVGEHFQPPYAFYGMPYGRHIMGFGGFGLLGCLVPLFLVFLFFLALRGLFWHGPRGWYGHMHHGPWGMAGKGDWSKGVPPIFAEWHQRAHEGQPKEGAEE